MVNEAISLFQDYGPVVLVLFFAVTALVKYVSHKMNIWSQRDNVKTEKRKDEIKKQLNNHEFFNNIRFTIENEVPRIILDGETVPVRQKIYRKLLKIKFTAMEEMAHEIVSSNLNNMSNTEWVSLVLNKRNEMEAKVRERAMLAGIPNIVVTNFIVWGKNINDLLTSNVNTLGISTLYTSNISRTDTLLYMLGLMIIVIIADAERSLMTLNGEISGLVYDGEHIE